MPEPIDVNAQNIDLSSRLVSSTVVVASPTAAVETIIASITIPGDLTVVSGIRLKGWAAFTVGTAGVSAQLRIRRTSVAGTVVADSGALTAGIAAAALAQASVNSVDTGGTLPGQVYKLTLTVASANAGSTVSAVFLEAIVV